MRPENHVTAVDFGVGVKVEVPISELIQKAPVLLQSQATFLLRETYEKAFGIYRHDAHNAHPLAHVLMNWSENHIDGSLWNERLREFIQNNVTKHTGISWNEWLQCPVDDGRIIMEECKVQTEREAKIWANSAQQLGGV